MTTALPSTAKMLQDAREILIQQLDRYKSASSVERFGLQEVKAVGELIRSVQALENQTEREQKKVLEALENATPEELEAMERDAARFLGASVPVGTTPSSP